MARDLIHDAAKQALINDNWEVTDDPYRLEIDTKTGKTYEVDLGAEKFIVAEEEKRKILVEIKNLLRLYFVQVSRSTWTVLGLQRFDY